MSLFDFDIEAALHTCSARIWAMENPEQHEANKKRSRCKATEQEIKDYKAKLDQEIATSEALERAETLAEAKHAKNYKPYSLFDKDANTKVIKQGRGV
jgi:hypothetical protein